MIVDFTWRDLASFTVVAGFVSGLATLLLRAAMSRDFARRGDVADLSGRLERVELAVRGVPTHGDIRAVTDRVASVEAQVAVASAQIGGMREDVRAVQHDLRLLLTHMMGREQTK